MSRQLTILITALLLTVLSACSGNDTRYTFSHGAIIRGDTLVKEIALVFTGDEFGDGLESILQLLEDEDIKASFFFTGKFYRNREFEPWIKLLAAGGNYLGSHSDNHLLYCDWVKRDSLLVSREEFLNDLEASYDELQRYGISKEEAPYFLPPYEWYNDTIASWTGEYGLQLINFTPGTRSNADYTHPEMGSAYVDSRTILNSILSYESSSGTGLNGFILLVHAGTDPRRTDKFYLLLPGLVKELKVRGYRFVSIDRLLKEAITKISS
jgi:peptidoglycan/xylan/chitin deacetylase (PgdA/CDA1 family)